ncbi:MAG TPA: polysaccharide ABC transporter ATP-binding protein [Puia sp.]|nr:polysaccharide ABC transporter ATP-binding protein [Puia sp.]
MSQPVIKVENLSKQFIIAHEAREGYSTLRDTVMKSVSGMLSSRKREANRNGHATKETFWAINDVSFEISKGDRVGIIGRNGAGKSTLLKLLSRITEPSAGRITLNGRVASLLEVGTGFHPELTGRENIYLNGAILGMSRSEIRKKFDEIVAFAETEKFLDTPVKRYSSGMYVRLAFAIAAHLEPEILIVDEVLAVGDAQFQKKCLGKMEDVSKNEGRTVLFVSHNMGVVSQLCQTAILMQSGRLASIGNVNEAIQHYIAINAESGKGYIADAEKIAGKSNYLSRFNTTKADGSSCNEYIFDEHMYLEVDFVVRDMNPNLQIGIGLQDKIQNRIFTIIREIGKFQKTDEHTYKGKVRLPASLIAPNIYSFVVALWTKDGQVFDILENVCSIKIHDSGTDLAKYEGVDNGSVVVKAEWLC